eukprot:m.80324 g.80324  ORF g.80324 m.80324 type:complete len:107 (+) comp14538_c0_seq27:405-725(+)
MNATAALNVSDVPHSAALQQLDIKLQLWRQPEFQDYAVEHTKELPIEAVEYQHARALKCSHLLAFQALGRYLACGKSYDYRLTRPHLRKLYFRSVDPQHIHLHSTM